jgi:hypothetical protein
MQHVCSIRFSSSTEFDAYKWHFMLYIQQPQDRAAKTITLNCRSGDRSDNAKYECMRQVCTSVLISSLSRQTLYRFLARSESREAGACGLHIICSSGNGIRALVVVLLDLSIGCGDSLRKHKRLRHKEMVSDQLRRHEKRMRIGMMVESTELKKK